MYIRGATANFNSRPSARGDQADDMRARLYAISIHAPPRGATLLHRSPSFLPGNFNSRPSARGDPAQLPNGCRSYFSIHAPPRGATSGRCAAHARPAVFNSRPSARGDNSTIPKFAIHGLFQFTPLREGRQVIGVINSFNFTISIHAPPRGATKWRSRKHRNIKFQFTPLREGRH